MTSDNLCCCHNFSAEGQLGRQDGSLEGLESQDQLRPVLGQSIFS